MVYKEPVLGREHLVWTVVVCGHASQRYLEEGEPHHGSRCPLQRHLGCCDEVHNFVLANSVLLTSTRGHLCPLSRCKYLVSHRTNHRTITANRGTIAANRGTIAVQVCDHASYKLCTMESLGSKLTVCVSSVKMLFIL